MKGFVFHPVPLSNLQDKVFWLSVQYKPVGFFDHILQMYHDSISVNLHCICEKFSCLRRDHKLRRKCIFAFPKIVPDNNIQFVHRV